MCRKLTLCRDFSWGLEVCNVMVCTCLDLGLAIVTLPINFCLGYISETVKCRKLLLGRDIAKGLQVCNMMV